MSFTFFDSRSSDFKRPFGALKTDEQAEFCLHLPKDGVYRNPFMLLYHADEWDHPQRIAMSFVRAERTYNVYSCRLSLPAPQLYFYSFEALENGLVKRLSRNPDHTGIFVDSPTLFWQLTVYSAAFETPEFLKGGFIYQIFPDRFCFSGIRKDNIPPDRKLHDNWYEMPDYLPDAQGKITNSDYFQGDLRGVISKLDYLRTLGVTCIYLNPIFEAHSSHRYNTANYFKVDPLLGNEEDVRELCSLGASMGISVILDGVFSHTGDDSIYFNRKHRYTEPGAYNSKESRFYHWYHFSEWPDKYEAWWGFDTLPNVQESNDDFIDFICGEKGVLHYWLSLGVSGFRLDVADELPDKFLDALTASVKAYNPQAVVLGEVWEDASNKVAYGVRKRYFLGAQLDSVMNYPFKDGIIQFIRDGRASELNDTVLTILENYPKPVVDVLMNPLSTHDVERAITMLVGEPLNGRDRNWSMSHHFLDDMTFRRGKSLFELAQVLQFFLPGVPSLYYGDEAGMSGYRDPFNRCTYPWNQVDEKLLAFTQNLSALRAKYRLLLSDADFMPVYCDNSVYCFTRSKGGSGLFIAVNRGTADFMLDLPFTIEVLAGSYADMIVPALSFLIGKI